MGVTHYGADCAITAGTIGGPAWLPTADHPGDGVLGAGHAWHGLALRGRPLLVLLVLLVSRMAGNLQ